MKNRMQKRAKKTAMSYEPEADILRIESSHKRIDHASELGNAVVHFSADGSPVYIEILEASRFLRQAGDAMDVSIASYRDTPNAKFASHKRAWA